MADLKAFRDLLEQAEKLDTDIQAFESRKTSLEQDIVTLTAKKEYVERQLQVNTAKLEEKTIELRNLDVTYNTRKDGYEAQIAQKEADLAEAETKRQHAVHVLETIQLSHDEQIAILGAELKERRAVLAAAKEADAEIRQNIEKSQSEYKAASKKLLELDNVIIAKQSEADQKLVQLDNRQKVAQNDLEAVQQLVERAQADHNKLLDEMNKAEMTLASIEAKHQEYLEYEKRSRKTLEAQEQALNEKEKRLEVQINTSRRRSILDN